MEYQVLYRRFRPEVFADVQGQEHITKALSNQIETGKISHAYLFCGTRGTGKTTMARILSRAVNCMNANGAEPCNACASCESILNQSAIDVLEIDAASNTSVDNIREIRDEIQYAPAQLKYKVYIIDEVHMLSTGAFNALLKTLEEPPKHVIFILATTESQKVPATILSRCQRYDFRRMDKSTITNSIKKICESIGITIEEDAADQIAYGADGSMRDAHALLDKCVSSGETQISKELTQELLGIIDDSMLFEMTEAIGKGDCGVLFSVIKQSSQQGRDPIFITSSLIDHFRSLLICSVADDPIDILEFSKEKTEKLKKQTELFDANVIINYIKTLSGMYRAQKEAPNSLAMLEIGLVAMCAPVSAGDFNFEKVTIPEGVQKDKVPWAEEKSPETKREEKILSNACVEEKRPTDASIIKQEEKAVDLDDGETIIAKWSEIVDEIMSEGRFSLSTHLRFATPRKRNGSFYIVFDREYEGSKSIVDTIENMSYLSEQLRHFGGKDYKVRCAYSDEIGTKMEPEKDRDSLDAAVLKNKFPGIVNIIDEE